MRRAHALGRPVLFLALAMMVTACGDDEPAQATVTSTAGAEVVLTTTATPIATSVAIPTVSPSITATATPAATAEATPPPAEPSPPPVVVTEAPAPQATIEALPPQPVVVTEEPAPPPPPAAMQVSVVLSGLAFAPASVSVTPGSTVTWVNNDGFAHDVTAGDGSFGSSTLNKGDSYSAQFPNAGTFSYICTIHPFMHGTVVGIRAGPRPVVRATLSRRGDSEERRMQPISDVTGLFRHQRAVRAWSDQPVPDELVRQVVEAATHAPSGLNSQPWRFLVVRDQAVKEQVSVLYEEAMAEQYQGAEPDRAQDRQTLAQAPVLIVPCVRVPRNGRVGFQTGASVYPACQNLMLAARSLGLGTVLSTLHRLRREQIHEVSGSRALGQRGDHPARLA